MTSVYPASRNSSLASIGRTTSRSRDIDSSAIGLGNPRGELGNGALQKRYAGYEASSGEAALINADFAKIGACGLALLTHGLFVFIVGVLEVSHSCVTIRPGLALFVGIGQLVLSVICLVMYTLRALRSNERLMKALLGIGSALLCLTAVYVVSFYALLSVNLEPCSSNVKLLLGSPTISCLVLGIPANFLPIAVIWHHRKYLAELGQIPL